MAYRTALIFCYYENNSNENLMILTVDYPRNLWFFFIYEYNIKRIYF